MRDHVALTEEEEGKDVLNAAGDTVGRVTAVEDEKAHVDPAPGLSDAIRSKLGWGDDDGRDYVLDSSSVESISDDAVHLGR